MTILIGMLITLQVALVMVQIGWIIRIIRSLFKAFDGVIKDYAKLVVESSKKRNYEKTES